MTGHHDRLLKQLEDLQITRPGAIPCRGPGGEKWTSDAYTDLLAAAEACNGCPAKAACGGYALAADEVAGVWGGLLPKQRADRTRKNQWAAEADQKKRTAS